MARIAVDLTPLRPGGENGGVKVLVLELLRAFGADSSAHRYLLLTAGWNHDELAGLDGPRMRRFRVIDREVPPDPEIVRGRIWRRVKPFLSRAWRSVRRRVSAGAGPLGRRDVDLLFCPFTAPTHVEPGIPVVSVVHDLQHRDLPDFFSAREIVQRDAFMDEVRRKAACIVCVSESVRCSVMANLDVPAERTAVIPNAIHGRLESVPADRAKRILSELGLARPYFFYPANYWPHKNHRMLLVAYGMVRARLADRTPDLVLTGALQEPEKELRRAVDRMGLSGRVHFLGYLPDEPFRAVWQGCAALVFPSLYEGFGIPVLEAMALGKPVLAGGTTSLPEVGGDAAAYFDPRRPDEIAEAMVRLATDPGWAADLSRRGRVRASAFDPAETVRRYLDVFAVVLANPREPQPEATGLFPDGWTGSEVVLSPGSGAYPVRVQIELEAPAALPHERVVLVVRGGGRRSRSILRRGERIRIDRCLSPGERRVSIAVSPVFRPMDRGMGPDTRDLGLRYENGRTIDADGRVIEFPKGNS